MAQLNSANPNLLPGIVTDQPEIYESEPALSDDTGINDLDLITEPTDDAIALIEVPIKQAFSYFAERENEIAKFYVQRHGEYKLSGNKPEEETDIEKYHRLVSEVNELLNKFQAEKAARQDGTKFSAIGSLSNVAVTSNLEVLSKQLKALEFAADDGSLNPTQSEFQTIKSKLSKLGDRLQKDEVELELEPIKNPNAEMAKLIRMSALERRLNMLETLLGQNEAKTQTLFKTTKCESLTDAAETLSSWLNFCKPESVQRVNRELDFLAQRLDKIGEQSAGSGDDDNRLDSNARTKIDQLCNLVTSTDKYRTMVPTVIHRLNAMEELQQKAAQVVTTVSHLELVQSQIVDSLQASKEQLSSLNEMFGNNMEQIKEFSAHIDSRIASIKITDEN